MSRSTRHTPVIGFTTAASEAPDKKIWHRRMRARERDKLILCRDWDNFLTTLVREVSNPWVMSKDGRQRLDLAGSPHLRRYLRK